MSISTVCTECWWQQHENCWNGSLPAYGCTCTTCAEGAGLTPTNSRSMSSKAGNGARPMQKLDEVVRLSEDRNGGPYCVRCDGERGGPYGHETNECTWGRS